MDRRGKHVSSQSIVSRPAADAAPRVSGGHGRGAASLEHDAWTFGWLAAAATVLLGLAFLCGCVRCVDGVPVLRGDKTDTRSER